MGKRGPKPDPQSVNQQTLAKRVKRTRPQEYDEKLVLTICRRIAEGETLRGIIIADPSMPTHETWYRWMRENPSLVTTHTRAREDAADTFVEQGLEIVDDPMAGASGEALGHARLRSDYRKWAASKYKPRSYGDKLEVGGDLTLNIVVQKFTDAQATLTADAPGQVLEGTSKRE